MTTIILEGQAYYYPSRMKDFTIDDNDLTRTCPLDNHKHHIDPKHDLGALDTLPVELLGLVLLQTDLCSLIDFRLINNRAMQVVDSLIEHKSIQRHAPDLLRGILSVEMGPHISIQTLFATLKGFKCEDCGDFAGFIYLLTCRRVCFYCFTEKPMYFPLTIPEAERKFGIHRRLLTPLPAVKTLPGRYSPDKFKRKARLTLIDSESARQIGIAYHEGSSALMESRVATAESKKMDSWRMKVEADSQGDTGATPRRRRPAAIVQEGPYEDPRRFMTIVHAPWIRQATNAAEWGFHCVGCNNYRPLHWRRKYCAETFDEHIKECRRIFSDGRVCWLD
jgi:hypothetical protein